MAYVRERSSGGPLAGDLRVTLQFHPDRAIGGVPVLEWLRRDGRYRSQFETGISNGGLMPHPGSDRWRWESRMFGTAYDIEEPAARPVYGSLDHRRRSRGGSPRFGSSYLRLTAAALERTTFCYPDSHLDPVHFGVRDRCDLIARADADHRDLLDDYIEAHVHGPVLLDRDVEALVLDPCFRGTAVAAAAARLPCPVEWHPGFRLDVADLVAHPEYRGPEIVACGLELARDGVLDAVLVRAGHHDEQTLKKVWHCIARFG